MQDPVGAHVALMSCIATMPHDYVRTLAVGAYAFHDQTGLQKVLTRLRALSGELGASGGHQGMHAERAYGALMQCGRLAPLLQRLTLQQYNYEKSAWQGHPDRQQRLIDLCTVGGVFQAMRKGHAIASSSAQRGAPVPSSFADTICALRTAHGDTTGRKAKELFASCGQVMNKLLGWDAIGRVLSVLQPKLYKRAMADQDGRELGALQQSWHGPFVATDDSTACCEEEGPKQDDEGLLPLFCEMMDVSDMVGVMKTHASDVVQDHVRSFAQTLRDITALQEKRRATHDGWGEVVAELPYYFYCEPDKAHEDKQDGWYRSVSGGLLRTQRWQVEHHHYDIHAKTDAQQFQVRNTSLK